MNLDFGNCRGFLGCWKIKEEKGCFGMIENLFHVLNNAVIRKSRTTDTAQNSAIRNFRTTASLPYPNHFEEMLGMVSPAPLGNNSRFNGGAV